ncbi:GMC oxidoreductase [Abortiporus biennis]|nr:GMC oxidoreductase [Abortiporus biennis]
MSSKISSARLLLKTSVSLGVLLLVLRYWSKRRQGKPSKLIALGGQDVQTALESQKYDVIIVGGGTAGCALASRISEDPSINVLLLEAGTSLAKQPPVTIPAGGSTLFRSKHDYHLYTEAQPDAGGRAWYWPRAKLMGGCSNINAMVLHYGAPSDYDEWVRLQNGEDGAEEWSYEDFAPYFRKFERYNPSKNCPEIASSLHGSSGVIDFGHYSYTSEAGTNFIKACGGLGIPLNPDVNLAQGTLGATKLMSFVDSKGRRVTTESAYFTEDVLKRPNLTIISKASVSRILFDFGETTRASGVEFVDGSGKKHQVKAGKEVVLAAGAVHTPQLLMVSGVGPAEELKKHNIPIIAELPGVGAHLMDHPVVDLFFMDKTESSIAYLRPQNLGQHLRLIKALIQYNLTGSGPLTCNVAESAAFVRSLDENLFPDEEYPQENKPTDVTSGPQGPDLELFSSPFIYKDHGFIQTPVGSYFSIHVVLVRPKSKGTITLQSSNPFDSPIINPNYFSDPNDISILVRGVRLASRIAHAKPLSDMLDPRGDIDPLMHHNIDSLTDEEVATLVRGRAETLYHPACTARMAPLEDGGVVDPQLRVYGIPNLRIADASIFPTIISGHTAGTVIAIGEKAADLVKKSIGRGN